MALDDTRDALAAAVAEACEGAAGISEAAERLLALARADAGLYAALMADHEAAAARRAVEVKFRSVRSAVWSRPAGPDARAGALARINTHTLLDFTLPGGRRLGDATRAEVEKAASYYGKIAADSGFKQRWLAKVAAAAPKRGTVSDKLDAAALLRLQKEAEA